MHDTSKFWISINAILSAAICVVVYLSTAYWSDYNTKIVQLIESGADPVAVTCALQDDYGNNPVCIIIATKGVSDAKQ